MYLTTLSWDELRNYMGYTFGAQSVSNRAFISMFIQNSGKPRLVWVAPWTS